MQFGRDMVRAWDARVHLVGRLEGLIAMIEWWVIVINLWARDFVSADMWMHEDQCKEVIQKYLPAGVNAQCRKTVQPWQQEL